MVVNATDATSKETTTGTLRDEAAIVQTWVRLTNAWARGDAAAICALFDRDCDHRVLSASGRLRRGRDEFDRIFRRAFASRRADDGRSLRFSVTSVRFISTDVAVLDGTLLFTHGAQRAGRVERRRETRESRAGATGRRPGDRGAARSRASRAR